MHNEITSELRLPSLDLTAAACDLSSAASLSTKLEECASLPGKLRARAADVRLRAQAAELLDLRARLSAVEAVLKNSTLGATSPTRGENQAQEAGQGK